MAQLSDFISPNGTPRFQLKTFTAISSGDVVQIIPTGLVSAVKVSDYAAVPNASATVIGAISNGVFPVSQSFGGSLAVQATDGSIFYLTSGNTTASMGVRLNTLSSNGSLISYFPMTSISIPAYSCNAFLLSNGNICVTYYTTSPNTGNYAVYGYNSSGIFPVVAPTAFPSGSAASIDIVSTPLSGGGFASLYHSTTTALILGIYNNAGVLQNTVTLTTSAAVSNIQVAQLSNGNLVISYINAAGLYVIAVYSLTATVVVAAFSTTFNQVTGSAPNTSVPNFSVLPGYFAFGILSTTTAISVLVFSNAGVQQGTIIAGNTLAYSIPGWSFSLINDGTNFWFVYANNDNAVSQYYTQITPLGVQTTYGVTSPSSAGSYQTHYWDPSVSCIVSLYGTVYSVFSTLIFKQLAYQQSPASLANNSLTAGGASYSQSQTGLLMIGDGCSFCYSNLPTSFSNVAAFKFVSTSIIGISNTTVAAGLTATLSLQAGAYITTTMKGSPNKSFDHSAANIVGNRGTLMTSSTILKGL